MKGERPLVSVIVPTYNRVDILPHAIESVLRQTYRNFELHVVDDGSRDGTGKVMERYASERVFYYYQENRGQSAARNFAIDKARGDLIALLDSDNAWYPDKLEKQIAFLQANPGYDILYSDILPVRADGTPFRRRPSRKFSGDVLNELLVGNFVTNNTVLVDRKCFIESGGFDEELRYAEDFDLWLRFATRYRFLHHPEEVVSYRCEGDRLSANEERVLEANHSILKRFFLQHPDAASPRARRKAWNRFYLWRAESLASRQRGLPLGDVLRAIAWQPFHPGGWRILAARMMR